MEFTSTFLLCPLLTVLMDKDSLGVHFVVLLSLGGQPVRISTFFLIEIFRDFLKYFHVKVGLEY